jgi:hypothetical protein
LSLHRAITAVVAVALHLFAAEALAQGGGAGGGVTVQSGTSSVSDGFLVGSHVFFYSDNSSLGSDALNDGGAVYTRFDMQYNSTRWFSGIGLFYEQDTFGSIQKDTVTGLVVELVAGSFFFKLMPGYIDQDYTERSFAKRSGSYLATELGIRANLVGGWSFYEIAIHRRATTITQEDGREMADKIAKTEIMPMLGMGISL